MDEFRYRYGFGWAIGEPGILRARVATRLQLEQVQDEPQRGIDPQMVNGRLRDDVERLTRHDLKTPLASIVNIGDALVAAGFESETRREGLQHKEGSRGL